jgi:hypothetical protein
MGEGDVSSWRPFSGSSSLLDGYDEPEILLSSTRSVCLKGADAGQSLKYLLHLSLCCIALNSKINMICRPTHHYGLRQKVTAESAR